MIIGGEQRTPEWDQIRLGKITASRIKDLMATIKTGASKSRVRLEAEKTNEILTGRAAAGPRTTTEMQWGLDHEVAAAEAYEVFTGLLVQRVSFAIHPAIKRSGASPDGLVGAEGMVEIKCPASHTHIQTLKIGQAPKDYMPQMQWGMACAERLWCDFVSFDPRLPDNAALFIKRVYRDESYLNSVERQVEIALATIDAQVEWLRDYVLDPDPG